MASNYTEWTMDELGSFLSDYYKDVHGIRPRFDGLFTNRERMIDMLVSLDTYMDAMRSTPEGRQQLRDEGWFVAEPEEAEEYVEEPDYEHDQFRDDVEADADALASAGWGTDEDYGYYGEDF